MVSETLTQTDTRYREKEKQVTACEWESSLQIARVNCSPSAGKTRLLHPSRSLRCKFLASQTHGDRERGLSAFSRTPLLDPPPAKTPFKELGWTLGIRRFKLIPLLVFSFLSCTHTLLCFIFDHWSYLLAHSPPNSLVCSFLEVRSPLCGTFRHPRLFFTHSHSLDADTNPVIKSVDSLKQFLQPADMVVTRRTCRFPSSLLQNQALSLEFMMLMSLSLKQPVLLQ